MKVFLDTSLLSDSGLSEFGEEIAEEIAEQVAAGGSFYVSSVTHFQLLWGYAVAGMPATGYESFLAATGTEVAPLTKTDAEQAAAMKPARGDLLDALIAAAVKRHDANVWTLDRDFLKFLPKTRVRLMRP